MKPIVYEKSMSGHFYAPSYDELIDSMEVDVLLRKDTGDYQGDTHALVKEGPRYGYLQFGWGSCSGCDALEGVSSIEGATKLRDELYRGIIWHDSVADALAWFKTHDWKGDYVWHDQEARAFIQQAIAFLEGA
jgi:hypothetical protein